MSKLRRTAWTFNDLEEWLYLCKDREDHKDVIQGFLIRCHLNEGRSADDIMRTLEAYGNPLNDKTYEMIQAQLMIKSRLKKT